MTALSVISAARESPRRLAVVDGSRHIDFGELAERVRERIRVLSPLTEAGGNRSTLVALLTDERLATLEILLALIELECPFVPLHPRLTPLEREALLARLPVAWVISAGASELTIERRGCFRDAFSSALLERAPQLAALATSGSSGPPQVALLSRDAFTAAAAASAANLGWLHTDRWLLCLPVAHVGGLSVLTRCLIARRAVVLVSPRPELSSSERLAEAIREGEPSLISMVPTQLSGLLELEPRVSLPSRVRAILTGGAAAGPRLLGECADRGWPVLTSYGLTEACSQVATQKPGSTNRGQLGVGVPLRGIDVRIEEGVIHLRGATLLSGYIGGNTPQTFSAQAGFRTSDLGRFDAQGNLHVLGRVDDLIISGGENVAPWDVEAVLATCPGVLEACVFGVPDARWGEVVAAALRTEAASSEEVLRRVEQMSRDRLAGFKRPRLYACVSRFAQGKTGKLDRRATARDVLKQLRPSR